MSGGGRHLQKLIRRKGARRHARHKDGAFEEIDLVNARANRSAARALRGELEFAGAFNLIIDIVAEGFSIIDGGYAIPLSQGMQQLAIQQDSALVIGGGKAVQAPLAVDDADLKEYPVLGILAGGWIDLLQVEEPLLSSAVRIRPEDNLPGEGGCSCQWMHGHEERIVNSVEFDSLSVGRVDEMGMPNGGCWMAADRIKLVESPNCGLRSVRLAAGELPTLRARDIRYIEAN